MKYIAKVHLVKEGKVTKPGEEIELNKEAAKRLLEFDRVEEIKASGKKAAPKSDQVSEGKEEQK